MARADQGMVAEVEASRRYLASGKDYHRAFLDQWLPPSGIVADVGCGLARVSTFYDRPGRPVVGVEIDVGLLLAARRVSGAPLVGGNAFGLPFASGSVAAYVGLGVIEFDPDAALAEAYRVLAPGGLLYLSVTYHNIVRRRRRAETRWRGVPVATFSEEGIALALESHGFGVDLVRRSSLAWGLGPLRPLASVFRSALGREDEAALSYRLLGRLLRPMANSLLVVGRRARFPSL